MTSDEFVGKYFDYYMHLEQRFLATRNYVSFTTDNYSVYSNEYTSLLIAICSELDGLLKEVCGYPGNQKKNMRDYKIDVFKTFPNIDNEVVKISYFRTEIQPFKNISSSMDWWKKYNAVKHNRIVNIKDANLETVLCSLAGTYVLNRCMLRKLDENEYCIMERSVLFRMKGWEDELRVALTTSNGHLALVYNED